MTKNSFINKFMVKPATVEWYMLADYLMFVDGKYFPNAYNGNGILLTVG